MTERESDESLVERWQRERITAMDAEIARLTAEVARLRAELDRAPRAA